MRAARRQERRLTFTSLTGNGRPPSCGFSVFQTIRTDNYAAGEDNMIRQYHAQRRQGGNNPLGVGIIPVGAIFYLQDQGWWRDRYRGRPICRNPWIVEAFLNGTLAAAHRNRDTDQWEDVYMTRRSDTAIVRSLRDGRGCEVAVRILILHEEEGLRRDPATYPDFPRPPPSKVIAVQEDFRSARPRASRPQCRLCPSSGIALSIAI